MLRKLHQTLQRITDDFESRWHFNTSIAGSMELMNVLIEHEKQISRPVMAEVLEKLTLMLEPFAPYLAEELWEEQGRRLLCFSMRGRFMIRRSRRRMKLRL